MEEGLGMRGNPRIENTRELIHHIQSLLSVKEAACTSVLSKSWLHAWSTIPSLRFAEAIRSVSKEQQREHFINVVDHTLSRYLRDNIPIKSFDLQIDIENHESSSLAENWIRLVATKSCLKELSLSIMVTNASFTLPDVILSGKNLRKIRIAGSLEKIHSLMMTTQPVINCVSLRELHLKHVHISEEVLDGILSTCSLLVDVELLHCKGFVTIKIRNLHCLYKLKIDSHEQSRILEINDVPNLRSFRCVGNPFSSNTDSLGSVTHLWLGDVIMDDDASLDI